MLMQTKRNALTVLFFLVGLSSLGHAADVVLHLSLADEIALTSEHAKDIDAFIRSNAPGSRLESIVVRTKRFGYLLKSSELALRKRIQDRIAAIQLGPNDRIKILIIDTHGNSVEDETVLASIGKISETTVDKDFDEIFSSVRKRAAPDLRIVLNSCSTLCGTDGAASKRAGSLLNYFGARDGAIYGAITSETYTEKSILPSGKVTRLFAMAGFGISQVMMVMEAVQDPTKFYSATPAHHLFELVGLAASIAAALSLAYPMINDIWARVLSELNLRNVGKLLEYQNGELVSSTNISKFKDKEVVYGFSPISCAHALLRGLSAPKVE